MKRIHEFDDDSVTAAIVPTTCAHCGEKNDRVRMSLDLVISSTGEFIGLRTVAVTLCCGGPRYTSYPPEMLAELLDHLKHCPNQH